MHRVATLLLVLSIFSRFQLCLTDGLNNTFLWGFNTTMDHLSACSNVTLFVEAMPTSQNDDPLTVTVPPYTMYAFEAGGTPRTQNIGSDPHNLTWVVNHSPGTQLMLIVLDSVNNTGGIPSQLLNVIDGSTECLPQAPNATSTPSISANVTDRLETCQPWGLRIKNGIEPYTVILSALGSGVITIVTMTLGNNVLTYPNRVPPGTQLMASVYDSTGTWGTSTEPIFTFGSNDTTCPGLVTSESISNGSGSGSHSRVLKIVLGIVPAAIFILALLAINFWWRRHRRRQRIEPQQQGTWDSQTEPQDYTVSQYPLPNAARGRDVAGASAAPYPRPSKVPLTPTSDPESMTAIGSPVSFEGHQTGDIHYPSHAGTASPSAYDSHSNLHFAGGTSEDEHFPLRTTSKSFEGRSEISSSPPTAATSRSGYLSPYPSRLPSGASPPVTPGLGLQTFESSIRPSIVIQHVDGGSSEVQEIPPPYADRSHSVTDLESNEHRSE